MIKLWNNLLTTISNYLQDYLDKQSLDMYIVKLYFNTEEDANNYLSSLWETEHEVQYYSYNF